MFKKVKTETILGIIGLIFLLYVLYYYGKNKNIMSSGMTNNYGPAAVPQNVTENAYIPNNTSLGNQLQVQTPSSKMANPSDLLPKDSNNMWAASNPVSNNLNGISLLNPTQIVGINTQGSSLRNANLQERSEPPNPRTNTGCPWNISTIEPDPYRKPLEIGTTS